MLATTISPRRLHRAEEEFSRFIIVATPGTEPHDVLKPAYWYHLVNRLDVGSVVEVRAPDFAWFFELWLMDKHGNDLRWRVLRECRFNEGSDSDEDEDAPEIETTVNNLRIEKYGTRAPKWRVVDLTVQPPKSLHAGLITQTDANLARMRILKDRKE